MIRGYEWVDLLDCEMVVMSGESKDYELAVMTVRLMVVRSVTGNKLMIPM